MWCDRLVELCFIAAVPQDPGKELGKRSGLASNTEGLGSNGVVLLLTMQSRWCEEVTIAGGGLTTRNRGGCRFDGPLDGDKKGDYL